MKYLIYLLLYGVLSLSCSNKHKSTGDINSYPTNEKVLSLKSFNKGYILEMTDSCLTAELKVVTVDLTDSIINLVNSCDNKILRVLAGKYQYPDASKLIESSIVKDTITTITVVEGIGDYYQDYHEMIKDSIICIWIVENFRILEINKDSLRTISRIDH